MLSVSAGVMSENPIGRRTLFFYFFWYGGEEGEPGLLFYIFYRFAIFCTECLGIVVAMFQPETNGFQLVGATLTDGFSRVPGTSAQYHFKIVGRYGTDFRSWIGVVSIISVVSSRISISKVTTGHYV